MLIFMPIAVVATIIQVGRNAVQRQMLPTAGPWAVSLVRFMFGLPFTAAFILVARLFTPETQGQFSAHFLILCAVGALAQILAQSALLVCMQRSSFAIGTAFFQTSLPFTAVVGALVFHDPLSLLAWTGIAVVTGGLTVLSWPKRGEGRLVDYSPIVFGLLCGALTAVSANAFRQGGRIFEPQHPVYSALVCLLVVQAVQTVMLGTVLGIGNRRSVRAALVSMPSAIGSGFGSAAASGLWFVAYTLAPAALVRAVGVLEMPLAALTGRRLFAERLTWMQILAGVVTAAGVVMAAVGFCPWGFVRRWV